MKTPPYRVETERLVLRCWEPRDAPLLKEAVDSSIEHLRPWMPWAHAEPEPLEAKVELLRRFRGNFDLGTDFVYGIFERDESRAVGGTGIHSRESPEIGYWIRADATGRGYATEVTAALARVALELCGADLIQVRVEPENAASLAVPRKLGFVEEATLRRRGEPPPGEEPRDLVDFAMFKDAVSLAVAGASLTAFDAVGNPLS